MRHFRRSQVDFPLIDLSEFGRPPLFKVQNWPEYEAGLRRRGSLTLWIEDEALDHW